MRRKFTLNDLILYKYNELPADQIQAFETQMLFDEHLKEAMQSFTQVTDLLDSLKNKPSDASIRLILDYDRKSSGELELS